MRTLPGNRSSRKQGNEVAEAFECISWVDFVEKLDSCTEKRSVIQFG
jgi:hypothetical protein